jgi:hypothetical protein
MYLLPALTRDARFIFSSLAALHLFFSKKKKEREKIKSSESKALSCVR